jgi:spore coat protein U domain-containing protein, fimbrial subunit CupE1/2/3/6
VSRWLCAAWLVLAPSLVLAQSAVCTFSSTPGAAFGAYDDSSPVATDTATSVVARCLRNGGPANITVTLQIGPSTGSGQIATRAMRAGAESLSYNLYRDAARTLVWGQTAGADAGTLTINGIPNNGSKDGSFVVYGRIPAGQSVAAGAYSDSVQLTVSP